MNKPLSMPFRACRSLLRPVLNNMLERALLRGRPSEEALKEIERLVAWGADPNLDTKAGWTPLSFCSMAPSPMDERMAKIFLEAGADPDKFGSDKQNPLGLAAKLRKLELCEALMAAGADPEARDGRGRTALDAARAQGRDEMLVFRPPSAEESRRVKEKTDLIIAALSRGVLNRVVNAAPPRSKIRL